MGSRRKRFVFDNYGGSYQLRIHTAEDLRALEHLDEPFWVATSAPVDQLRSDPALLQRLDRDGDGRILSSDIRAAVVWMFGVLANCEGVDARSDVLYLDHLDASNEEGSNLRTTAQQILQNLGHSDATALTLEAVRNRAAIVARGEQNGDGVIPLSAVKDEAMHAFVSDIMETVGDAQDLNGEPGVDEELLDRFLSDAGALLDWQKALGVDFASDMFPLGVDTSVAYGLVEALREPVERYFELCKVVGLNRILGRETKQPESDPEVYQNREKMAAYLESAPIARPRPEPILPYEDDVNPAYAQRLRDFRDAVAARVLGEAYSPSRLTEDEWKQIRDAFATYEKWLESKTGGSLEPLGPEKLSAYVTGDLPSRLRRMIEADRAAGPQLTLTQDLEFLILMQRWILELCNNYVSFPYLYDPDHRASFEQGRVIMDGKVLNLNIRVNDVEAHSVIAERSGIFLLYSEVTRDEPQEKFHIVTPVARVDLGNLGMDKRGVLFDLEGREWDVKVVKVVENVVSLEQALLAPFRRAAAFVKDTVGKIGASAEEQIKAGAANVVPVPGAKQPSTSLRDVVLAGGVSVAALGTSFAYIGKTFADPMAVFRTLGVILAVIGILLIPVGISAALKLHARNLSTLLEASGFAINTRMRLTRSVGRIICLHPRHPHNGFTLSHRDFARIFSQRHADQTSHKPANEE